MGELALRFEMVASFYVCHPNRSYRVYYNRTQAKKNLNLSCAQLELEQFQEVNFLPLIRYCVVIDLYNTALHDDE